ncbi:MAG: YIP1 family protein, partial [Candidatus Helarchaeota archaeon]
MREIKENLKNISVKVYEILTSPSKGFKNVLKSPDHSSIAFLFGYGIFCLIFLMLLQFPTILSSIFLHDAGTSLYPQIIFLIYFSLVFFLYVFILLNFQLFNLLRRKIQKIEPAFKEKTKIINIYVYSLVPYGLFCTQIPFIIIFGGHYNLFFLSFFIISLFLALTSWHFILFYKGLKISLKNKKNSRLLFIIYISVIISIILMSIYLVNFSK